MSRRLAGVMVLGAALVMSSAAYAQRGPGGPGGFPGRGFGPGGGFPGGGFGPDKGAAPAPASDGADLKKLQAELDKLQEMIRDVEAQMKRGKEPAPAPRVAARDDRRPTPPMAKKEEHHDGPPARVHSDDRRSSFTPPAFGRGPWGFGPPWGGMPFGQSAAPSQAAPKGPPSGGSASASIEKRLDKVEQDLEEIKRLLRSRQ